VGVMELQEFRQPASSLAVPVQQEQDSVQSRDTPSQQCSGYQQFVHVVPQGYTRKPKNRDLVSENRIERHLQRFGNQAGVADPGLSAARAVFPDLLRADPGRSRRRCSSQAGQLALVDTLLPQDPP